MGASYWDQIFAETECGTGLGAGVCLKLEG